MKILKKILYAALVVVSILVALASILSVIRNTEHRYLKMLDFPRIQFFILSVVCLVFLLFTIRKRKGLSLFVIGCLVCGILINGSYLINYTPLVSKTVPDYELRELNEDHHIGILFANIKMSNRNEQSFLKMIADKKPDVVIALEVDTWWDTKMAFLNKEYPYTQKVINDETYGILLYSKLPITASKTHYFSNPKVPSFKSTLQLKNDKEIVLYTVHPVPPTHFENFPDNKGEKEKELILLGNTIENENKPVIVAGDLNDVSWGYTDKLTETKNLLHDVRIGRGFYNSFNADNFFTRWPLDHVFVTQEFSLVDLERLPYIHSDHYPIFVKLAVKE